MLDLSCRHFPAGPAWGNVLFVSAKRTKSRPTGARLAGPRMLACDDSAPDPRSHKAYAAGSGYHPPTIRHCRPACKAVWTLCLFGQHRYKLGAGYTSSNASVGLVSQPLADLAIGTTGCCIRHWRRSLPFPLGACRNVRSFCLRLGAFRAAVARALCTGIVLFCVHSR